MDIHSVCVCNQIYGGWERQSTGHSLVEKSLPCLSVVQSVHGSYDVSVDGSPTLSTGPMGVFVAPRGKEQRLRHCPDPSDGTMTAQWLFLDVEVNRHYRLDDLYTFPVILPSRYNEEIYTLLRRIGQTDSLLGRLPAIDRVIEILLEVGSLTEQMSETTAVLQNYIENHYTRPISAEELARTLHCARSGVYKYFQSAFGTTPSHYINGVRIRHARMLLEETDLPVAQVGAAVGIPDASYFSKLFRRYVGCTMGEYRAMTHTRGL